jgi:hypothetical protein
MEGRRDGGAEEPVSHYTCIAVLCCGHNYAKLCVSNELDLPCMKFNLFLSLNVLLVQDLNIIMCLNVLLD